MQYQGLKLTEQFESCRLTAYQDVRGIWTIGWGHTGTDVRPGLIITQQQADALLFHDIQDAVNHVNHLVTVPLTQNQFDALCDFAYNAGCAAFAGSTLLRLLNAGDYNGAAAEFPKWDHSNGQVIPGLLCRRLAEQQLFR